MVLKISHRRWGKTQGRKKEYTPPPWHPSFLGLSPDPEVTEQRSYGVHHFPGERREKGIHTICPERRVYTIEASDPEKGGFSRWWGKTTPRS